VRYLIIGAGAVGGTIGALLTQAGRDVVLVARGAHLAALRDTGLRFATPRGLSTLSIPAVGGPEELDLQVDDVLLLCVKGQDTEAALAAWADRPVAGGGVAADRLPVVCAQNGVENERVALRRFARVYGMSVLLPAGHVEPGLITAVSDPVVGVLMIGRYPAGLSDGQDHVDDPVAAGIAADLSASRFVSPVVADVMRWKYAKLLRNLANAIEAICGPSEQDPQFERVHDLALDEGVTVLAAAGIDHPDVVEQKIYTDRLTRRAVPGAPRGGGSSWQSVTRGTGTIESDYLNGEIVLLGRLHRVPTPVNARLQRLAVQAAATGRPPGSTTAGQILADL
jgi:2-dehydropantoate 2-reductase